LRALGSVEDEMAPIVRPQKLPLANTVRAWFSGIPLTLYPHLRASLTAVSPPSTPVFMGSTRSYLKAKIQKTKTAGYIAGYSLHVSSLSMSMSIKYNMDFSFQERLTRMGIPPSVRVGKKERKTKDRKKKARQGRRSDKTITRKDN
jgi:hypothetical protein